MLITIAIPTYNNEKTIAKAIKSALEQDYNDEYEVLVVNNASKDGTKDVIDSFKDDKLRIVINKETCDMYSNHNVCLKEATGDYVLFCHSDDELFPNALTILAAKIKERGFPPRYILWGHSLFRDFYPSVIHGEQQVNTMFSGEAAVRCFAMGGLTPSGTCYSRQSLLEIGGFPSSNSKAPEMDWVIMVLAAFNYFEFEMIDRIYFKRMDASTAVRGMTEEEWIEVHKDTFDKMFEKMSDGQITFFINNLISKPSPIILKSIKGYLPKKTYIKKSIKVKLRSMFN